MLADRVRMGSYVSESVDVNELLMQSVVNLNETGFEQWNDGDVVVDWPDAFGREYSPYYSDIFNLPTIKKPSQNGLSTIVFNGTPMEFPANFKIQPNASIYMIVKSNSVGGALQTIMGTQGITAVTAPRFYIAYHNGYLMRTQGAQTSSGVAIQDEFVVFGVRHNEVGDMVLQVNDVIVEANGHITQYNDEVVKLGFGSYRGLVGEIGEIVIFDRMLNDAENRSIIKHLRTKWGV